MKTTMKHPLRHLAAALALMVELCSTSASAAPRPLAWTADFPGAAVAQFDVRRGTDLIFAPAWRVNGKPAATNGWTISLAVQTNGAPADAWSEIPGAVFAASNDWGAAAYNVLVRAVDADGTVDYSAAARLRMLPSPGFQPGIPLPVKVLDFAAAAWTNAPWATAADLSAATNALSQSMAFGLRAKDDLAVYSNAVSVTGYDLSGADGTHYGVFGHASGNMWIIYADAQSGAQWGLSVSLGYYTIATSGFSATVQKLSIDGRTMFDLMGQSFVLSPIVVPYAPTGDHLASESYVQSQISAAGTVTPEIVSNIVIAVSPAPGDYETVSNRAMNALRTESDPTVPAWAKSPTPPLTEESDPIWEADKPNYATSGALASVSNTAATAALNADTALRLVLGESVWFLVTNYMRTVEGVLPSLELWEVRNGATNLVYSSKEEITNLVHDLIHDCRTNLEATVAAAVDNMPSKAWGTYQSGGADNPQPGEVTIVNSPTVILTGGGEFNKYVDVGDSSIWVLASNGIVGFGGDTNGNFLAVQDDEGNVHFKVAKTDSYDLPAILSDVLPRQSSGSVLIYAAATNRHGGTVSSPPVLSAATDLRGAWHEESAGEVDALGLSVSWAYDATIPAWVATVAQDVWAPRLFLRAKVTQEGGVAIINTAPTRLDGGILIGGQSYSIVPYTSGGKTYLTLEATP